MSNTRDFSFWMKGLTGDDVVIVAWLEMQRNIKCGVKVKASTILSLNHAFFKLWFKDPNMLQRIRRLEGCNFLPDIE